MSPINARITDSAEADNASSMEREFERELAELQAESLGWQPLGDGAYLHVGSDALVIEIVGTATAAMASSNLLWVI
jgi:hypothetical protein